MNEQERTRWERQNEAFLAAALHWLRLRLQQMAAEAAADAGPEPSDSAEPSGSGGGRRGLFRRRETPRALLARPLEGPTDEELEQAAASMAEAARSDPPPPLHILSRRFGLSLFERHALLVCAALELDTRIGALCAQAQNDPGRPYPTFALLVALLDNPAWDALSPERPLRHWQLIEINQPGAEPLTTSALRATERVIHFIKGLEYLDERVGPFLIPFEAPLGTSVDSSPTSGSASPSEARAGSVLGRLLPASQQRAGAQVEALLRQSVGDGPPPVIQLVGTDPESKELVARHAARALGLSLYRMPVDLLPKHATELETLARLWHRESLLLPLALLLDAHDQDGEARAEGTPEPMALLRRFLARSGGVFFVSAREAQPGLAPAARAVEVDKPTPAEQEAAWSRALGKVPRATQAEEGADIPTVPSGLLAGQFNLNAPTIERIAGEALRESEGTLDERLWDACRANTRPRMDRLAHRLRPVATWSEIVLREEEMHLLRQLTDQVARRSTVYDRWGFRQRMSRGFGISALFTGESGTGKTMAAEVIANDLRLDLYRIDLSAVVSKYIGETEKNLRHLFDAAEDGGAILFFDEADALFGKRSEVRDSHDRYANIEINYLLQRMEAYRGLAILATNMKGALDSAFMRRLRFVVTFPFPGRPQRKAIWERAWPADTPLAALDHDHLARFNLTGGSIANVALNAAFLAAAQGTPVTMPLVLDAVGTELRKLERPYNEADLRWPEREPPNPSGATNAHGAGADPPPAPVSVR